MSSNVMSNSANTDRLFRLICRFKHLDGTSILQKSWQITLLGLQIRVSTNVLMFDKDIWNGSLASNLLECILEVRTVVWDGQALAVARVGQIQRRLTDLVEFNQVVFRTHLGQERFGGLAIRAIGFAKDRCHRRTSAHAHI